MGGGCGGCCGGRLIQLGEQVANGVDGLLRGLHGGRVSVAGQHAKPAVGKTGVEPPCHFVRYEQVSIAPEHKAGVADAGESCGGVGLDGAEFVKLSAAGQMALMRVSASAVTCRKAGSYSGGTGTPGPMRYSSMVEANTSPGAIRIAPGASGW